MNSEHETPHNAVQCCLCRKLLQLFRLETYRMPLIVAKLLPVDFERTTGPTASCERQLALAQVCAHHVRHVRVLRQEYQTGR